MLSSNEKEIDNPGRGDCGYYAFVIGLLPHVLKELRTVSQSLELANIDDLVNVEKDYNAKLFFYNLSLEKTPILFSLSEKISQGKCRLDSTKDDQIDTIKQKKLFLEWLIQIKKLETNIFDLSDFQNNNQTATTLLTGVYLLRTLLANARKDSIETVTKEIKSEFKSLEQKEEESQKTLEENKEKLAQALNKEKIEEKDINEITLEWLKKERAEIEKEEQEDKESKKTLELAQREEIRKLKNTIFEESQIANRTIEEKRMRAFENCYKSDLTKVNLDSITVLLKSLGYLSEVDDTKSVTTRNKEINVFANSFRDWWKANNNNIIPEINTKEFYTLKATYIACLYGDIKFQDRSQKDVIEDTNNWWNNPELKQDSIIIKVANVVQSMGAWAEEVDLKTLANITKIHLQFEDSYQDENQDSLPIITLQNSSNVHWKTKMPTGTVSQTFPILEKSFFREKDKILLVAEQLNQELSEFMAMDANIENWQIIYNLQKILDYEKNKQDATKLRENFFACKEKFAEIESNKKLKYNEKDPRNNMLKRLKIAFESPDKWITTTYEKSKNDTYFTTLTFEDRLEFPKIAEDMAHHLHQEFLALKDIKKIKNDPKKLEIVENLITTLNLKGKTSLSHNELIKNITTCKQDFQKNLKKLEKGLDKTGTSLLHKILYLFCWIFKIRVDAKIYEGAINKIHEVADIKPTIS